MANSNDMKIKDRRAEEVEELNRPKGLDPEPEDEPDQPGEDDDEDDEDEDLAPVGLDYDGEEEH